MKQQIRNKTFETNSSSIHSIALYNKPNCIEELDKLDSFEYTIEPDEFGWEKDKYTNEVNVLSYIWTYAVLYNKSLIPKIKEYLPNTKFVAPILDEDGYSYDAYIDHGEEWKFEPEFIKMFDTREDFAKLVCNSVVATWNDNSDTSTDEDWLSPKGAVKIFYKSN